MNLLEESRFYTVVPSGKINSCGLMEYEDKTKYLFNIDDRDIKYTILLRMIIDRVIYLRSLDKTSETTIVVYDKSDISDHLSTYLIDSLELPVVKDNYYKLVDGDKILGTVVECRCENIKIIITDSMINNSILNTFSNQSNIDFLILNMESSNEDDSVKMLRELCFKFSGPSIHFTQKLSNSKVISEGYFDMDEQYIVKDEINSDGDYEIIFNQVF